MSRHTLLVIGLALSFLLSACKGVQKETIVYTSGFQGGLEGDIINGKVEDFNGSKVLGRYSEGGFELRLKNLPKHDLIQVSFDLFIHDTWDGNSAAPNGRDIWMMNIDGWSSIYASFANGNCSGCTQSYPTAQPGNNNGTFIFEANKPNSNAIKTDLPGACELNSTGGGTSMYRIVRTFEHHQSTLRIGCFGQLEDPDAANKNCRESWSVDNLKITAIEFK